MQPAPPAPVVLDMDLKACFCFVRSLACNNSDAIPIQIILFSLIDAMSRFSPNRTES